MPLYHRQVHGLPKLNLARLDNLELSEHAVSRAAERGVPLSALKAFDPVTYPVFQVETAANPDGSEVLVKVNYRKRLNERLDYAVCFDWRNRRVISCWVQWRGFQPFINRAAYDRVPSGLILR